jgi:hypothetical protein
MARFSTSPILEVLPVTGGGQPSPITPAVGRFGSRTYNPTRDVNVIPAPRITTSVDSDNTDLIREGISSQTETTEGISDQKPHILMVSEFKPLFNKQTLFNTSIFSDTQAKKYFDTILETRRLKAQNSFLEFDRIAGESPEIKSKFTKIFSQNSKLVSFLREKFQAIVDIHAEVERFKGFLDPRDREVSFDDELRRNFPQLSTREILEENIGGVSVKVDGKELLEEIGFNPNNFQYYSNTKVLAQIIQGYRMLCKNKEVELFGSSESQTGNFVVDSVFNIVIGSQPNLINFDTLPNEKVKIFNLCYASSRKPFWNKPWDSGSITLLSAPSERIFSGNNTGTSVINYDKLDNVVGLLSTEFSVCFNRMLSKNLNSYLSQDQYFKTPGSEKLEGLNTLSVDNFTYGVLRDPIGSLVFEPQSIVGFKSTLDTSTFDKTGRALDTIKSEIDIFERGFLSLSKNFGFVPATVSGDNYSQLFSSKTLFDNIYYRFFNLSDGKPKWDLTELSSYVFSIYHNISSEFRDPSGSDSNEPFELVNSQGSANTIKYSLFLMLCSELGTESSETRKTRIGNFWNNLTSFFSGLDTASDKKYPVSLDALKTAFKTPDGEIRRFLDYRMISSQGESLYEIMSTTIKEFNYVISEFCLDESGRTNHRGFDKFFILLMVFEIILIVLLNGYTPETSVIGMDRNFKNFYLRTDFLTGQFNKETLISKLQERDNKVRKFFCFISGYMRQTKEAIDTIKRKIDNPALKDFLSDLNNAFPDTKISSKQQSSIALNSILDLQPLFQNPEMRTGMNLPPYYFVNSSIMGEKTKSAFLSLVKNNKFLSDGRIISVGIPNGFFDEILYAPKPLNSRWSYRQKDIVSLKIYKIELTRPDLVFLPILKEFELSRLIARDDALLLFDGRGGYDISIGQFPTRDFDYQGNESRLAVQYFMRSFGDSAALADSSYDGIPDSTKINIYKNHVESYLLEIYARIMSGISLAEGNISDFSEVDPTTLQANIKNILSDPDVSLESFETFDSVDANNPSTLSSTEQIALNILSPKSHDRVLNVLVRSDDFEIDVEKTVERGTNFFLKTDDDVDERIIQGRFVYKLKPREYSFESYFVTISVDVSGGVI